MFYTDPLKAPSKRVSVNLPLESADPIANFFPALCLLKAAVATATVTIKLSYSI